MADGADGADGAGGDGADGADEVYVALVSGLGKTLVEKNTFSRPEIRGPLVTVMVRLCCDGASVIEMESPSSPAQKSVSTNETEKKKKKPHGFECRRCALS
jgi:hypothetical protein